MPLAVLALVSIALQTSTPGTGSVAGFVYRAGTNEPIAGAQITLTRNGTPGMAPPLSVPPIISDNRGHFAVSGLEAGSYRLVAARNGFARQQYGERAPGRPGTMISLAAGQALEDVVFRLIPAGTVTGRVSDTSGEAVAGITVQLLRSTHDAMGRRALSPVASAITNDRGEYRLYWVTPGRYYVSAVSGPSGELTRFGATNNEVSNPRYGILYYPGTRDASAAASIDVPPGAELAAIDFRLQEQQVYRIQGRAVGPDGAVPRNMSIMLFPRTPGARTVAGSSGINYDPRNGTFELRDVPAGSYWLRGVLFSEPGLPQARTSSQQVAIDVTDDIQDMVLALNAGVSLPASVAVEGLQTTGTVPEFTRVRVFLTASDEAGLAPNSPTLSANGKATITGIFPGNYRVAVGGLPPNFYIKEARFEGSDVLRDGIWINGPVSESLQILVNPNAGAIDGTLLNKDGKPAQGTQAVLIPEDRERRDLYRVTSTDQYGHFTMRGVAPGDYKLFAWEDVEQLVYYDADFIRLYEERATRVRVSESATIGIEMKIIPASQ
jgi:hypothetical protein